MAKEGFSIPKTYQHFLQHDADEIDVNLDECPEILDVVLNRNFPESLINYVPDSVANAMERIPKHLYLLSDKRLADTIDKKPRGALTSTDWAIKVQFWTEYDKVKALRKSDPERFGNEKINIHSVVLNSCSGPHFYAWFLRDDHRVAWLTHRAWDYKKTLETTMLSQLHRYQEILNAPLLNENGQLNHVMAGLWLKAMKEINARVLGAPMIHARIQQESRNVNLNIEQAKPIQTSLPTIEDLDRKIKELEAKNNLQLPAGTLEAEVVKDEDG